ncbi:cation transporter-like protein [Metarhizium robertsii ARSEF 23]|uniref:Cation transporter-like protein n=1 Tax=Metarhizium robertsii (strain ARSEF 23 / ATCC MYA-3075) TaxID=655844 RepID=A0A0B2XGA2_METRA|nr:cation transporter-like protein [Metarhizium robertsii ARSEF 23]KHO10971.1 cation transporter-like protein [Metarhizium robertsii ARSEF 23]
MSNNNGGGFGRHIGRHSDSQQLDVRDSRPSSITIDSLLTTAPFTEDRKRDLPLVDWDGYFATKDVSAGRKHLALLRHFRYTTVPWMEAGDLSSTFGTDIMRLAQEHPPIQSVILDLSANQVALIRQQRDAADGQTQKTRMRALEGPARRIADSLSGITEYLQSGPSQWRSRAAREMGLVGPDATALSIEEPLRTLCKLHSRFGTSIPGIVHHSAPTAPDAEIILLPARLPAGVESRVPRRRVPVVDPPPHRGPAPRPRRISVAPAAAPPRLHVHVAEPRHLGGKVARRVDELPGVAGPAAGDDAAGAGHGQPRGRRRRRRLTPRAAVHARAGHAGQRRVPPVLAAAAGRQAAAAAPEAPRARGGVIAGLARPDAGGHGVRQRPRGAVGSGARRGAAARRAGGDAPGAAGRREDVRAEDEGRDGYWCWGGGRGGRAGGALGGRAMRVIQHGMLKFNGACLR